MLARVIVAVVLFALLGGCATSKPPRVEQPKTPASAPASAPTSAPCEQKEKKKDPAAEFMQLETCPAKE